MDHSSPNPWLYAGVLERIEWRQNPMTIRRWDGRQQTVVEGDRLLLLRTPAHVSAIAVEKS